jgi:ABC-type Fe3+-hydroxamate transport system substrate-binding protein
VRIVSLCPSLTELVFDLGSGDQLVGRTRYCVHPEGLVDAVEDVGGTKDPELARIIELAPDIVLFNEEENRREDHDDLVEAGVRCLNTFPKDALDTAEMVREIGGAIGRDGPAEEIASDIERRVEAVRHEAGGVRVRWAYLIWRKPWMSVNADTFASALLDQAGGVNVFGERDTRYPTVELGDLSKTGVDLVLLCTEPFAFTDEHIDEVVAATGLDRERVRIADGEYLSWHGSRTPDGVDYAAGLIREAREEPTGD